jgi:hypothetical protein
MFIELEEIEAMGQNDRHRSSVPAMMIAFKRLAF